MRKSGQTSGDTASSNRRWLRGPPSSPRAKAGATPAAQTASRPPATSTPGTKKARGSHGTGKRFVEPYQYDDEQRTAIAAAMAENGLGDDMTREIFIGAIAYDLALLQSPKAAPEPLSGSAPKPASSPASDRASAGAPAAKTAAPVPSTSSGIPAVVAEPRSPSRSPLADAARGLAACLGQLDDGQRASLSTALKRSDPFDRAHGDSYLTAILREVERIAEAAFTLTAIPPLGPVATPDRGQEPEASAERKTAPKPSQRLAPDPAAIAFIRHAASVYEQCFDAPPSVKPSDPFARVLAAIAKTTGIVIPIQAQVLKQALRNAQNA